MRANGHREDMFSSRWVARGLLLLMSLAASVTTAMAFEPVAPFKALCIQDAATGFNWESGKWKQANFKAGDRFIVSKLTRDEILKLESASCSPANVPDEFFGFRSVSACYTIKEFGEESIKYVDGEMCEELYTGDVLSGVRCKQMSFLPNGDFIKLPWHSDIRRKPPKDYKDSLVLSIGVCSKISQ
jgi:hypothetical protein